MKYKQAPLYLVTDGDLVKYGGVRWWSLSFLCIDSGKIVPDCSTNACVTVNNIKRADMFLHAAMSFPFPQV